MTYGDLDRLFYENLRITLVANGVLPDVTQYTDDASWRAARNDLTTSLKAQGMEIFDIFNVGSGDERGTIKNSRFTIGRGRQERGSLAVGPEPYTERIGDKFRELQHLDFAKDIIYEIRCLSNSVAEEEYMLTILDALFGQRRFFHPINSENVTTTDIVLVEWNGGSDLAVTGNQREYMYEYVMRDVWVGTERILRTDIPMLNTVDFFAYSGSTPPLLPNQTIKYNELPNS